MTDAWERMLVGLGFAGGGPAGGAAAAGGVAASRSMTGLRANLRAAHATRGPDRPLRRLNVGQIGAPAAVGTFGD